MHAESLSVLSPLESILDQRQARKKHKLPHLHFCSQKVQKRTGANCPDTDTSNRQ